MVGGRLGHLLPGPLSSQVHVNENTLKPRGLVDGQGFICPMPHLGSHTCVFREGPLKQLIGVGFWERECLLLYQSEILM